MNIVNSKRTSEILGVSISTLHRIIKKDPSFPKKRYISPNRVGFVESEVYEWLDKATQPKTFNSGVAS